MRPFRPRLEHLGLLACRWPARTLLLIVVLSAAAVIGFLRLDVDADLRNVFRSDKPEFAAFERAAKAFPAADRDVLVLVTGPAVATRSGIDALRRMRQEIALADGVSDVFSITSVRRLAPGPDDMARIFPNPLPRGEAFQSLIEAAARHPLVQGKLLSRDRRATLIVVRLDSNYADLSKLRPVIAGVDKIAKTAGQKSGLTVELTGIPVMRILVTDATIRDQIIFNLAGAVLGLAICFLFFRNWRLTLIALAPAVVAVLWALGGMGLAGQKITYLTNVVPVLVMIIAFCDAMHLTFGIQKNVRDGRSVDQTLGDAVRQIGPACVLTTLTTAIALLSLSFAGSDYVAEFGLAAGFAILTAFISVILLVPLLGRWLLREDAGTKPTGQEKSAIVAPATWLSGIAAAAAGRAPGPIALVGCAVLVVAGTLYFQNEGRYQYRESLPRNNAAYRAIDRIDRDLGGANEVQLLIEWSASQSLASALPAIRDAHRALSADRRVKGVWSAYTFVRPFDLDNRTGSDEILRRLAELPEEVSKRVIAPNGGAALVMGYVTDAYSGQMNDMFAKLERNLAAVRKAHPQLKITLTGFPVVSARLSDDVMGDLQTGLLLAVVLIVFLLGVGFGSARIAVLSLPVNLFPLAAAGAFLFVTGSGLQFSSVLAMTVAFGIAVDDTIHFLNAYRGHRAKLSTAKQAAVATIAAVGPVLVATTAILAAGLGLTFLSELPTVQLFGTLVILVLVVALVADMLFLPALLSLADRRWTNDKETRA